MTSPQNRPERLSGSEDLRMNLRSQKPILICVDLQQGFLEEAYWGGNRNNKNAEEISSQIIATWRKIDEHIIHVRHSSTNAKSKLHKSSKGFEFHPSCLPDEGEIVLTKSVNSCFIGTPLKQLLDEKNCTTLVIIGLTTDHCVSTTARMAANYGYNVLLVSDAMATFNKIGLMNKVYDSELIHQTALASLKDEFATIVSSDELFEMLGRD
jgi:nicotinamidase-related amidase